MASVQHGIDSGALSGVRRRWTRKAPTEIAHGDGVAGAGYPPVTANGAAVPAMAAGVAATTPSAARLVWLLGRRGVELTVTTGEVRTFSVPAEIKSGSRAVRDPRDGSTVIVLENGSSRLLCLRCGTGPSTVEDLTRGGESSRFNASLGSRLLFCWAESRPSVLVTGTPGRGAHTPWLFDLASGTWAALADAPHPILSSATFVLPAASGEATLVIAGGWSKERSCHGYLQRLPLSRGGRWSVSESVWLPWRRPGAGCWIGGRCLIALGWMECEGEVGTARFRLLRRNGAAQRHATSSSRLISMSGGPGSESIAEVATFPLTDSFEHNGEVYSSGSSLLCVGRDHVQIYDTVTAAWRVLRLPAQLLEDSSSSWVKHCGSWALACVA